MVWCRMVSNGVEWCGVKWCQVSVMTLESLVGTIECYLHVVNDVDSPSNVFNLNSKNMDHLFYFDIL